MKNNDRFANLSRKALAAGCGSFARTIGETYFNEPAASALPLTAPVVDEPTNPAAALSTKSKEKGGAGLVASSTTLNVTFSRKMICCIWVGLFVLSCGCQQKPIEKPISLFDGQSLDNWELTEFGGEGDVRVEEGCIVMDSGDPFTAINLPESFDLPRMNYEIEYEAMKVEGSDFFGTITFPVNDSFCSMVIGGWAGTVVGLSSIDGVDASENETRLVRKFERNQWYRLRVRVTPESIQGWIDDERVINQSIVGKEVSIRSEMIPCQPLGIANFYTIAKLRNIQLRSLASP